MFTAGPKFFVFFSLSTPFCSWLSLVKIYSQDLEQLAAELRADIVYTVSKIGGHLSSSLGVVELSVALHHVFNTPKDNHMGCGASGKQFYFLKKVDLLYSEQFF